MVNDRYIELTEQQIKDLLNGEEVLKCNSINGDIIIRRLPILEEKEVEE